MPVEHPPAEEAPFVSDTAGEWVGSAPDDDDAMLAPAPDASAFAYHAPPSRSTGKKLAQSSEFKQTLIPILLTSGLLLIVFGLLKFILGPDSPYSNLPGWVIGMTCGMGALLLVFALFTMLQVKDQLSRSR